MRYYQTRRMRKRSCGCQEIRPLTNDCGCAGERGVREERCVREERENDCGCGCN
ncbi:MAG: hypothetical protein HFJ79_03430 [Clostridiales bacterium]|jgi:hypothetical protein|nr:hypothetical protein [Clostridiales bacterium]